MLESRIPTESDLIRVCEVLIAGTVSREEVFKWTQEVLEKFGVDYCVKDFRTGNRVLEFVLGSFFCLMDQGVSPFEPKDSWFLREQDFVDYLAQIKLDPMDKKDGNFTFLHGHELPIGLCLDWRVEFLLDDEALIERLAGFACRGICDVLGRRSEFSFFEYNDKYFYVDIWYDPEKTYVDFSCEKSADVILGDVLFELGISSNKEMWMCSQDKMQRFILRRTDDYGHSHEFAEYDNAVQAQLARDEYEAKGHKQLYEVIDKTDDLNHERRMEELFDVGKSLERIVAYRRDPENKNPNAPYYGAGLNDPQSFDEKCLWADVAYVGHKNIRDYIDVVLDPDSEHRDLFESVQLFAEQNRPSC